MELRTLYLQSRLSINGRDSLMGRVLYDHLKKLSGDSLLAHAVLPDKQVDEWDAKIRGDLLPFSLCDKFSPTLIYLEGGLFLNHKGTWRIPREKAEEIVAAGTVMVVADCDPNRVRESQDHYDDARTFLRATIKYGGDGTDEVYLADLQSNWNGHRTIVCKPAEMILSDWVRPVYEGVGEIVVGLPSALSWYDDILATGNKTTTGTMCLDTWIDRVNPAPFASVAKLGNGFVVFIAAGVSSDAWLERRADNHLWLSNTARFLLGEAERERKRSASHLRSPFLLFFSHRSVDKEFVSQVARTVKQSGLGIWIDQEQLVASDSLVEGISRALQRMTHFVLFWSKSCVGAPWVQRELNAAVSMLLERKVPILIARLDETPVPAIVADILRIEGMGCSPGEMAESIVSAVDRLNRRAPAGPPLS